MAKRKGSSTSGPRTRSKAAKEAREVDNAQRLDKLPPEVWEKILDELDENDLFPLALSCRYFRQKQKELVARDVLNKRWRDRRALKTSLKAPLLWPKYLFREPPSADYLRFCSKERVSREATIRGTTVSGAWRRIMAPCLCCGIYFNSWKRLTRKRSTTSPCSHVSLLLHCLLFLFHCFDL